MRYPTSNARLIAWVQEITQLCRPGRVHWCDGSETEYAALCDGLVAADTATMLNPALRPHSYLCRSAADDVARIESRTFICSEHEEDAGPTNNWCDPAQMRVRLHGLFVGSMQGRTLYVVPFRLGPAGSALARFGVELTDSAYVVCHMRLMTHMGATALAELGEGDFVPCLHSVGSPLEPGQSDVPWPCNSAHQHIVHFPESREIVSFGSGYGGNALLGKKCFALRIASRLARDEGWLAEHMLIVGVTNPEGRKKYMAAAFPSQCGKTNLAMMLPTLPGWKVECVGDDIAWMHFEGDGRLYAVNPEAGFFAVAPGTSARSNPHAIAMMAGDTLFTNVAQTQQGDVWWEGLSSPPPPHLVDWQRRPWTPQQGSAAAHPNARFTCALKSYPSLDAGYNDPRGVPIAAILFGGRRAGLVPLVRRAQSWAQGVYMGATLASETTAAAAGETGRVRRDPFAMLPFCGYHMGDYFAHWLQLAVAQQACPAAPPLPNIYSVNWFRKDAGGNNLWPGYGENARVLKWIFDDTEGTAAGTDSPIGVLPAAGAIDLQGSGVSVAAMRQLLQVDADGWLDETQEVETFFADFGKKLPTALWRENERLAAALGNGL